MFELCVNPWVLGAANTQEESLFVSHLTHTIDLSHKPHIKQWLLAGHRLHFLSFLPLSLRLQHSLAPLSSTHCLGTQINEGWRREKQRKSNIRKMNMPSLSQAGTHGT